MAVPVARFFKGSPVGNVLRSLPKRGLLEKIPAADDQIAWRCDEGGQPVTMRASSTGLLFLGNTVEQEAAVGKA